MKDSNLYLAREKETEIVDCDMMPCVELSTLQQVLENKKIIKEKTTTTTDVNQCPLEPDPESEFRNARWPLKKYVLKIWIFTLNA